MKKFIFLTLLILTLGACSSTTPDTTAYNEPPIGTENSTVGSDIFPGIITPDYEGTETNASGNGL